MKNMAAQPSVRLLLRPMLRVVEISLPGSQRDSHSAPDIYF